MIHAGVYYAPGSLKARLCVDGARELYAFCADHAIAHVRCGKLIVAAGPAEVAGLDELERRGRRNRVPGLRRLDAAGLREYEPQAAGVAALHSPATGVVDFAAVTRALAADLVRAGGVVATGCGLRRARPGRRSIRLEHERGVLDAGFAVFCAGRGPIAWPSPPAPIPTRGSSPSAAPTCACVPSGGSSCAR